MGNTKFMNKGFFKVLALAPVALFAANASAFQGTYTCQPKAALVAASVDGYAAKPVAAGEAVQPTGFRIDGNKITVLALGQNGELVREEAGKAGNATSCAGGNQQGAHFTIPADAATPDVFSFPAEAFQGAKEVNVTEVLDEDADGMACHGYVWDCQLNNN